MWKYSYKLINQTKKSTKDAFKTFSKNQFKKQQK